MRADRQSVMKLNWKKIHHRRLYKTKTDCIIQLIDRLTWKYVTKVQKMRFAKTKTASKAKKNSKSK